VYALGCGAGLIVSGDRHLTGLKNFVGIGIVRLANFPKLLMFSVCHARFPKVSEGT
jgi:hypothetical protein